MRNKLITISVVVGFALAASAADSFLAPIVTVTPGVSKCHPDPLTGKLVSVQCKSIGCHVGLATQTDGGGSSTLGTAVDTNSVLVNPNVLYDVDVNLAATPYLCVMGQDGGVVKADLYIHSGR